MTVIKIYPTRHFIRAYKSLPDKIKISAGKKEKIFKNNPFDPRLKTHKLKGRFKGCWAYSVSYQYRILFRFVDDETVLYYDIDTHDIYK